jgi:hypothetical protein
MVNETSSGQRDSESLVCDETRDRKYVRSTGLSKKPADGAMPTPY